MVALRQEQLLSAQSCNFPPRLLRAQVRPPMPAPCRGAHRLDLARAATHEGAELTTLAIARHPRTSARAHRARPKNLRNPVIWSFAYAPRWRPKSRARVMRQHKTCGDSPPAPRRHPNILRHLAPWGFADANRRRTKNKRRDRRFHKTGPLLQTNPMQFVRARDNIRPATLGQN